MIGVILAAGVGSRLRPITNDKPKCLVEVAGRALLDFQLDAYRHAGVERVLLLVGYESTAVENHCRHIRDIEIVIIKNLAYEDTNNMYSLYLAREHLEGKPFVLNNGDLAVDHRVISRLLEARVEVGVAVDSTQHIAESMKVATREDGTIHSISKELTREDAFGCSIDFYKFGAAASTSLFATIRARIERDGNVRDWTEVALHESFAARTIDAVPVLIDGLDWVEIDDFNDLALADLKFSRLEEWVGEISCVLFDLDGTLLLGDSTIPGGSEIIESLRAMGHTVRFISNNSSRSRDSHAARLREVGIECAADEIILSTDGLIAYLNGLGSRSVHVLGTTDLRESIAEAGIDPYSSDPEFVVVGYDTALSYESLKYACELINSGIDYIATHSDVWCPTPNGPIPDIGAITALLQLTTGRAPTRVFGKPSPEMTAGFLATSGAQPHECLVVGDRLHMDIEMANRVGMRSALVLTGETQRADLERPDQPRPNVVIPSVASLADVLWLTDPETQGSQ